MNHVPHLITDLGLILGAAGIITLLFKWLKQPVVLGYIIAGFLVGPNFSLFPSVVERAGISTWAEIGVIFLLFGLGLEFSFRKLLRVGGTAAITAIIGVSSTLLIGYMSGKLLGWGSMDSIFFGGMLSIASTMIIIRAFSELDVKANRFAGVVMGVLIIEDLVAVVLLVLLSTLAVSRQFSGVAMGLSVLKLCFFLVLWFLCGIFVVPSFLKFTRKLMNDETMLIVSLALCFMMVMLAANAGFSAALGAFVMGSILAETLYGARIEHLIQPVKDLFGAIFFVSVGMLIDVQMLLLHMWPIVIGTLVLLISKPLFAATGALISGQPLKTSVRTGMSLSQIGEFSFIIATLGISLKVTSDFLYPVAVTISVVTAFTTPYMIRLSEPVYRMLDKALPTRWNEALKRYSNAAQTITTVSDWRKLLRVQLVNMVAFGVVLVSIVLLATEFIHPFFSRGKWGSISTLAAILLLMLPFLWALAFRRPDAVAYAAVWRQRRYRGPLIMLQLIRIGLAVVIIGFLVNQLYSPRLALAVAVLVIGLLLLFSRKLQAFYNHIELRFLQNLNEKELHEAQRAMVQLAPWDAHIAHFTVNSDSPLMGKTLLELALRENFGVNIAMIERGSKIIMGPSRDYRIYPGDVLSAIGTDDQLRQFAAFMLPQDRGRNILAQKGDVVLRQFVIGTETPLKGQTIRESGIRERTRGIIVGIEREGTRILNPDSSLMFEEDDIVWIVGSARRLGEWI
jgi:CPA2 family monovalent cation:H+ antiporter-2